MLEMRALLSPPIDVETEHGEQRVCTILLEIVWGELLLQRVILHIAVTTIHQPAIFTKTM